MDYLSQKIFRNVLQYDQKRFLNLNSSTSYNQELKQELISFYDELIFISPFCDNFDCQRYHSIAKMIENHIEATGKDNNVSNFIAFNPWEKEQIIQLWDDDFIMKTNNFIM